MSDIGQCLRDTGRPQQGVALLERALGTLPEQRVTARAKKQIHLATAYLELRDYEKADQVTAEALAAIGSLSSSRIVERVKGLRRRANRRHNDLDDRIADFLD
jgi:predicted Zn-dependent protease